MALPEEFLKADKMVDAIERGEIDPEDEDALVVSGETTEAPAQAVPGNMASVDVGTGEPVDSSTLLDVLAPRTETDEEAPPKDTPKQEEPAPDAPPPDDSNDSMQQRIAELSGNNKRLQEQLDYLTRREMERGDQQQKAPEFEPNPEAEEYLTPYFDKYLRDRGIDPEKVKSIGDIESRLQPIVQQSGNHMLAEFIRGHIPDFKDDEIKGVRSAYENMTDQDKQAFGEGPSGALAIAYKLRGGRGASSGGNSQNSTSPLAARAQADISSQDASGIPQATESSEEAAMKRFMALPDHEIRRQLAENDLV